MKTLKTVSLMACMAFMALACKGERYTDPAKLPETAKEFLQVHYPDAAVVSVERDDLLFDWEVLLKDGSKVDFSRRGKLVSAEAPRGKTLPTTLTGVMPAAIGAYLAKEYPGAALRKISLDGKRWEVELLGVKHELIFDAQGKYLGADD